MCTIWNVGDKSHLNLRRLPAGSDTAKPQPDLSGPPHFIEIVPQHNIPVVRNLVFGHMACCVVTILKTIPSGVVTHAHLDVSPATLFLVPKRPVAVQFSYKILSPVFSWLQIELFQLIAVEYVALLLTRFQYLPI
jgi:hypothetical protein